MRSVVCSTQETDCRFRRGWLGPIGESLAADADHNNVVDVEDYNLWKQVFGSQYDAGGGNGSLAEVPEPGSAMLVLIAAIALATRRRAIFR